MYLSPNHYLPNCGYGWFVCIDYQIFHFCYHFLDSDFFRNIVIAILSLSLSLSWSSILLFLLENSPVYKHTIIVLSLNNSSLIPLPSSYHPISLLPFTTKVLKIISGNFYLQWISSTSLSSSLQPGFHLHHITELLLPTSRMNVLHRTNLLEATGTIFLFLLLEILFKLGLGRSYFEPFGLSSIAVSNFHMNFYFLVLLLHVFV